MDLTKVTISGEYIRQADNEMVSFDDVSFIMPVCKADDVRYLHMRGRFAIRAIREARKEAVASIVNLYMDDSKPVKDSELSFWNKDINKMSQEELQDLAAHFDLRAVPLYKKSSLKVTQNAAAKAYSEVILGKKIATDESGVDVIPAIIVKRS